MGYQRIDNVEPNLFATKIGIEIHTKALITCSIKHLVRRRLYGRVLKKGDRAEWNICGNNITCMITEVEGISQKAGHSTEYSFQQPRSCDPLTMAEQKDIYITSLTDMIRSSLESSGAYSQLNIPVAKSVLIHGASGVGKSWLIRRVSRVLSCAIHELSCHELLSFSDEEYGLDSFKAYNPLSLLIKNVSQAAVPSLIVLRDLDLLTPKYAGEKLKTITAIISACVDKISSSNAPINLIGIARDLKQLPDAYRKTDIFRQHMLLPIPSLPQRKQLLTYFLNSTKLKGSIEEDSMDDHITQISLRTSGYVARDLERLIRLAKLKSMRSRDVVDQFKALSLEPNSLSSLEWTDIEYALDTYKPSQKQLEQIESTMPKRTWNDLGGYQAVKDKMKQAVLLPLLQPEVFKKLGIKPPSGLLLYGPSGCGKTALVQALVSESMMNVISIKGPEIFSKYLGETEGRLRKIFATAKRISPCLIFIDEMDAIGAKRGFDMGSGGGGVNERVLSTLLNEMDGVEGRQGVVVVGCTNRPDQIDDAILRPGRLDQLIYIELPSLSDRIDIINTIMKRTSVADDIHPEELAKQTEFCTGADLENLFREAGTVALRDNLNAEYITNKHIQNVLTSVCERAENQVLQGNLDVYERLRHRQFK